ncbi:MAG: hypothetical protein ACP5OP_02470 [Leptospirillia bacterium]
MSKNRIPGLSLGSPEDEAIRVRIEQGIRQLSDLSLRHAQSIERLRAELRDKNREISELRRSVATLRRERERLREIFLSLEKKLLAMTTSDPEEKNEQP